MELKRREEVKLKILKDFSKGNFKVNYNTYGISPREFSDILIHMKNEKLIDGISVAGAKTNSPIPFLESTELTSNGIKYLEENSFKTKFINIAIPTGKALGWCIGTGLTIIGLILAYLAL